MTIKVWSSLKQQATSTSVVDNAGYRLWAQNAHLAMLEVGLVVDTISAASHADLTTASLVNPADRSVFKIYELNDGLSSTFPIYIKVCYGGAQANATYPTVPSYPCCYVSIGTTVNASGVLGGLLTDVPPAGVYVTSTNTVTGATATANLFAKGEGFFAGFLGGAFAQAPNPAATMAFVVERIPDDDGEFTVNGYTVVRPTPKSNIAVRVNTESLTLTITPDATSGWLAQMNPCYFGTSAASANGVMQFQRFNHCLPSIRPMRSMLAYSDGVMPAGTTFPANIGAGGVHRYYAIGGGTTSDCWFYPDAYSTGYSVAIMQD